MWHGRVRTGTPVSEACGTAHACGPGRFFYVVWAILGALHRPAAHDRRIPACPALAPPDRGHLRQPVVAWAVDADRADRRGRTRTGRQCARLGNVANLPARGPPGLLRLVLDAWRSEEHTSELQ